MKKEKGSLDRRIKRITLVLLLLLLIHSTTPSSIFESWVEKGCSGSTLSLQPETSASRSTLRLSTGSVEPLRPRGNSLLLFVSAVGGLTSAAHAQNPLKIPLYIKNREIWVEVAKTPEERVHGLMGRRHLGRDAGMLFVFKEEDYHSFWMEDTRIPLSIAFIDKEGRIISIKDMKPLTLETHTPPQPILYALEMKKGWFSSNRIKVGDIVRFSK